jgi:hypothetical protein
MTRAATGDTVVVKPTNNVYTVLTGAALIAAIAALAIVILRARELGMSLF